MKRQRDVELFFEYVPYPKNDIRCQRSQTQLTFFLSYSINTDDSARYVGTPSLTFSLPFSQYRIHQTLNTCAQDVRIESEMK